MRYRLRAKTEIKLKDENGELLTYLFDRGLDPFEIAKAMMVLHASNNGLLKLKDDMGKFLQDFIEELKNEKIKRENAQ